MIQDEIIKTLTERGFRVEKIECGFDIEIGHRSVGVGLNEIFVETKELTMIKRLGDLAKIMYVNNAIKLTIRNEQNIEGETVMKKEQEDEKRELPSLEERVQAKIEEKG
jgi:hypothetical protein